MTPKELYNWYYVPGEFLRSIGFYINPYKKWEEAKFRHIFSFDGVCNLYVGQYSVYQHHIEKIFNLDDERERGILYPMDSSLKPQYSDFEAQVLTIRDFSPVVEFTFIETKQINYLNMRLKKIAQRLYDYGMPQETVFISKEVDLWQPSIKAILKGSYLERPEESELIKEFT